MKIFIYLILIISFCSCKENNQSRIKIPEEKIEKKVSTIDYHKIIDVVLDTFKSQHDKIIRIEYKQSSNPIDSSRRNSIMSNSRLAQDEKELAIKLLENNSDHFNFNRSKLNENSLEILKNSGKTTDKNLTYYFNSFLSNENNDLVVSTVGAIMNNEKHRTRDSGASLIMFFKKEEGDIWKLSNFTTTVEY